MSKQTTPTPQTTHAHDDDEVIIVPKGEGSKFRFFLTMGLVLFVLLIFMVTGPMMSTLTGSGAQVREEMAWNHPSKGRQSIDSREFILKKRALASFMSLTQGRSESPGNEDVAFWIMMDELAQDAGIRVTDKELGEFLRGFVPEDRQVYKNLMKSRGTSIRQFEEMLREQQRIRRYRSFLAETMSKPSPDAVERRWMNEHQEYAFDYVELEVASLEEDARAELPDDAALKEWFDALPEQRRNGYQTPEKIKAELLYLTIPIEDETATAKLLEVFPRPDIEDPEDLAKQYHTQFSFTRFRRDEPLPLTPEERQDSEKVRASFAFPYDEVTEECAREAPAYFSLTDWQQGVTARETGSEAEEDEQPAEEVSLAVEAEKLGMAYANDGVARTQEEWNELEVMGGRSIANSLFRSPDGKIAPRITLETGMMGTGRVIERIPPAMPPFEEIREQVADDWVAGRTTELAVERLEAVRAALAEADESVDAVRPEVSSEAFAAAAQAKGFEVKRRDWAERRPLGSPTPAYLFFRATEGLYSLREEEVAPAQLASDGKWAFLVRQAGLRDPDPSRMNPNELDRARAEVQTELLEEFNRKNLNSQEWFRKTFGFESAWATAEDLEAPAG